ncbi:MAG: hypothetical protein EOP45_09335, partial [Sphingobacteriaceae bacterium]
KLAIAASTTAIGRERLYDAKRLVEKHFSGAEVEASSHSAEVIYGDSVTGYTPTTFKMNGVVYVADFDTLSACFSRNNWEPMSGPHADDREYMQLDNFQVWSADGWTKAHRIMRHKLSPHKKILRIQTGRGYVDVTDEHSLLDQNGKKINAKEAKVGQELLHKMIDIPDGDETAPYFKDFLDGDEDMQALRYNHHIKRYIMEKIENSPDTDRSQTWHHIYTRMCNSISTNLENKSSKIESITEIEYDGYVYDLTTDNHQFAAGVGDIIVSNTDSNMVRMKHTTEEEAQPVSISIPKAFLRFSCCVLRKKSNATHTIGPTIRCIHVRAKKPNASFMKLIRIKGIIWIL